MAEDQFDNYQNEARLHNHVEHELYLRMRRKLKRKRQMKRKVTLIMQENKQMASVEGQESGDESKMHFKQMRRAASKQHIPLDSEIREEPKRAVSNKENVPNGVRREYVLGNNEGRVNEVYGEFEFQEVIYQKPIP